MIDDRSDPGSWKAALDMVNSPPHYQTGGIETIDYIQAELSPEEFAGYCRGNALNTSAAPGIRRHGAGDRQSYLVSGAVEGQSCSHRHAQIELWVSICATVAGRSMRLS